MPKLLPIGPSQFMRRQGQTIREYSMLRPIRTRRAVGALAALATLTLTLVGTGTAEPVAPDSSARLAAPRDFEGVTDPNAPDPGAKRHAPAQDLVNYPKLAADPKQASVASTAEKHDDVISLVKGADGRITGMRMYTPAPGWTEERLADELRASGEQHVVVTSDPFDAVRAADRAAGSATLADPHPNTGCSSGIATTNGCPPLYWSNNGYTDPQVRFNDHSGAGWPVSTAVSNWNQAPGIDSHYLWNSCPFQAGARCVDVKSGNFGNNGWHGSTDIFWYDGTTYRLKESGIVVNLNDYYGTGNNWGRKVACHEIGHALGAGHATGTGSCMWDPASGAAVLTPGQDYLNLLAQTYSIYRQP